MKQSIHHELNIPKALEGRRFDQALAALLPQYSRSQLKSWIDEGEARLNQLKVKPKVIVSGGDAVVLSASLAASHELAPQAVEFDVIFEDGDLIVVNKPPGLVVHPGAGNADKTLVNGLALRFPELTSLPRAGLIHRIDKDTSGLIVVARHSASFQALVRAMAQRKIGRTYEALVNGTMVAGGTIDAPIGRHPSQRTRMAVVANGRAATTHYRVRLSFAAHTLLEVTLETGRTHQIRVHLAHLGHPLVGDARYGARLRVPQQSPPELSEALGAFRRQALHAERLNLSHPVSGEPLQFKAPRPPDLDNLITALEESR